MEHTVEKLSSNKVKISFKAPAADFEEAVEKAYLKMRGQISVPGFRKGKAPRKLIERMYGAGVFYEDALEILFPDAYMSAVKDNDLKPVGRPEPDVQEMEAGKDLAFSCEVFVFPDVKLGQYKGVEVARRVHKVTADEVDARIEQERKRVARSVDVTDRALENGDKAELDYAGTVDGVAFAGGTAEHQTLVIGSGNFIPGFEEQMVGMTIGEERDLKVTFPEQYHAEDLKGKDAVFHVKLHAITREELPDVDDEFAAEVSDFDTLAEYRADLEKKMQEAADAQAGEAARMPEAALEGAHAHSQAAKALQSGTFQFFPVKFHKQIILSSARLRKKRPLRLIVLPLYHNPARNWFEYSVNKAGICRRVTIFAGFSQAPASGHAEKWYNDTKWGGRISDKRPENGGTPYLEGVQTCFETNRAISPSAKLFWPLWPLFWCFPLCLAALW